MIISNDIENNFTIRNRKDLSVIKTINHDFGFLYCGLCYSEQNIVMLGIGNNIVEFDYEENIMKMIKYVRTKSFVL